MNKVYLAVTVVFIGVAVFVAWHTFGSGQVFAKEEVVKDYHQNMMKAHHGENWREGCTKMMENLDDKT